jgi:hypothetical protein
MVQRVSLPKLWLATGVLGAVIVLLVAATV